MTKFISKFLLALGLLLAIACLVIYGIYTQPSLSGHQVKMASSYMTMNNNFYQVVNSMVEKEIEAKGDILYHRDPQLDVDKQSRQIDDFVQKKVNVIILNPVDGHNPKLLASLKRAKKRGIKLVVVDSQLSDKHLADVSIVSDNYQAGRLIAQRLMANESKASILVLEHQSTQSARSRVQGFLETIAAHPNYKVVAKRETKGQTEQAMPQVKQVITSGVYFDTIMALNDRAALGALAAVKSYHLDNVGIYSVDGSPDLEQLLGTTAQLKGTVAQSPKTMGKRAISAAYALLKGKKVPKTITIDVNWYDKASQDVTGWQ